MEKYLNTYLLTAVVLVLLSLGAGLALAQEEEEVIYGVDDVEPDSVTLYELHQQSADTLSEIGINIGVSLPREGEEGARARGISIHWCTLVVDTVTSVGVHCDRNTAFLAASQAGANKCRDRGWAPGDTISADHLKVWRNYCPKDIQIGGNGGYEDIYQMRRECTNTVMAVTGITCAQLQEHVDNN